MALLGESLTPIDADAVYPGGHPNAGHIWGQSAWAWAMKKCLVRAGGVVTFSTTRTSGSGIYANNATNTDQWATQQDSGWWGAQCAIQMPAVRGVQRSILIATSDAAYATGTVKIARSGVYNIASGGAALVMPTLAGEEYLLGDAGGHSPDCALNGNYLMELAGQTTDLHGCYVVLHDAASSGAGSAGFWFALDPLATGTYETGTDDVMIHGPSPLVPSFAGVGAESGLVRAWRQLGEAGESFGAVKGLATGPYPGTAPVSPRTGMKSIADMRYLSTAVEDLFGKSSLFRLYGPSAAGNVHSARIKDLETGLFADDNTSLVVGPLVAPWIEVEI